MKNLKGILIDLDDTFYAYEVCNRAGIEAALEKLSKTHGKDRGHFDGHFFSAREEVKKILGQSASSHSRLLYFKKLTEKLTGRTDPKAILELENEFWNSYFSKMAVYEGALHLLHEARELGLKVGVITNLTTEIQLKKLLKLGIHDKIDFLVTSEEVGAEKPDPKIYFYALEMMGLAPHEVIMIGDSHKEDVEGAARAGIRAVRLESGFLASKRQLAHILELLHGK